MAVVRITDTLISEVTRKIRRVTQHRMEALQKEFADSFDAEQIYSRLFGDIQPTLSAVPTAFLTHDSSINLSLGGHRASLDIGRDVPMPVAGYVTDDGHEVSTGYAGPTIKINQDSEPWKPELERAEEYGAKYNQVRITGENLEGIATKVLKGVGSLGPALKAWPPLWELLPEYAKSRHKEVVERKARTKKQAVIDTVDDEALKRATAAVVAIRLSGK